MIIIVFIETCLLTLWRRNFLLNFSILCISNVNIIGTKKGKGKAIPLQAWTGPEGSSRLRLPDFKTIGT
jgi:hypothetical protein